MTTGTPAAGKLPDPVELRALAEQAARAGGQTARRFFGSALDIRLKEDDSEVSEADHAAQSAVVSLLREFRPDDAFITEEQVTLSPLTPSPAADRVCWVVDPLDGTRNFVRGIPVYVCSVAAMYAGEPIAGAIYDPVGDVPYSVARGHGLLVNGHPTPAASDGVRATGLNPKPVVALPSTPTGFTRRVAHRWLDQFVCRSLGCTALQMAWVALGKLDAMLADNPRLWDIAAGALLITEAGGWVASVDGSPLFPFDVAHYTGQPLPMIAVHDRTRQREFVAV